MKRNWRKGIIGGLSFTSALFIFQACYGIPQDFYPEIRYSGQVKSKSTGQPLSGIKVTLKDMHNSEYTNEEGEFLLFSEIINQATLQFEDVDSTENGSYTSRDTLLVEPSTEVYLEIELEEK